MESTVKILKQYGALAVIAIRNDLQKVSATGKTARSIRFEVTSPTDVVDKLTIYGRPFTPTIETGRGPRKDSKQSDFEENLLEWVKIRFGSLDKVKQVRLAKFLRWKINKEGDKTHRMGGKEVYTQSLYKAVDEAKAAIRKDFRINFSNFVKNSLHGTNNS